jgi:transposase-like protein
MLKAIHSQEDINAAREKASAVVNKLKVMKLGKASEHVAENIEETLRYMEFPSEHWKRIRTNNPIERVLKEVKRRTKVVGAFPDGESALMLTAARLRHVASSKWSTRKYMNIDLLYDREKEVGSSIA